MKKPIFLEILLLFFLILTLSLSGFSKEKTITSNWVTAPLAIDGSCDEWEDDALNFEKKVSVEYAFKNDAENFYIIFIFKDPRYLSSINATKDDFLKKRRIIYGQILIILSTILKS